MEPTNDKEGHSRFFYIFSGSSLRIIVSSLHPITLRSGLMLSSHLQQRLPSGHFPSTSPTKILLTFLIQTTFILFKHKQTYDFNVHKQYFLETISYATSGLL
jgi:hypothetical protein